MQCKHLLPFHVCVKFYFPLPRKNRSILQAYFSMNEVPWHIVCNNAMSVTILYTMPE